MAKTIKQRLEALENNRMAKTYKPVYQDWTDENFYFENSTQQGERLTEAQLITKYGDRALIFVDYIRTPYPEGTE